MAEVIILVAMKQFVKGEGVVLYSKPFGESDQILEVLSKEWGRLKLFSKRGRSLKKGAGALQPLSHVELLFQEKETTEFKRVQEVKLVREFARLKESFEKLEIGCKILNIIRLSQPFEKPTPSLYTLLLKFLGQLEITKDPQALYTFFALKLALHDGLLSLSPNCAHCDVPIKNSFIFRGENSCSAHAVPEAVCLNPEERSKLEELMHSRSLGSIEENCLSKELHRKVEKMTNAIYLS